MAQDSPPKPLWLPPKYLRIVTDTEIDKFGKSNQTDTILKLSKDICVPARQNFSVKINFFPFQTLAAHPGWLMARIPGIRERISQPLFERTVAPFHTYLDLRSPDFKSTRVSLPATIGNYQLGKWGDCDLCGKPTRCVCVNYSSNRHMICHRSWLEDNRLPYPQNTHQTRREKYLTGPNSGYP